ncbi:hypothetical protein BABINDRAFT_163516 [Babjeviella inositovora NRRL Y-12698]|uniref:Uncharacterized protein n=1 Tax=Babjeviella inositovora NRRL Y-12698 TaxID=984486 RepID=A0A1E3QII7_9ASCO|nr:uncharacterized protein BABINDRAFT_163516 [Babjeviella inositovora NRRL Y-12698]ODQ77509.1 hypothetical protein BABINDRAFT_163516 [Babjeviella inositovora NRRL Y-12698]
MASEWSQLDDLVHGSSDMSYFDDEVYVDEENMDPCKAVPLHHNQLLDGLDSSHNPLLVAPSLPPPVGPFSSLPSLAYRPDSGSSSLSRPNSSELLDDPVLDSYLSYRLDGESQRKKKVESMMYQLSLDDKDLDLDDVGRASARSKAFRVHGSKQRSRSPIKKASRDRKVTRSNFGKLFDVEDESAFNTPAETSLDLSLDEYFGISSATRPNTDNILRELDHNAGFDPFAEKTALKRSVPSLHAPHKRSSLIPVTISRLGARKVVTESPKRIFRPNKHHSARPILKPPTFNRLNMLVYASNGDLDDATKYATELNATNARDIPLPDNTDEVVTIPVANSKQSAKAAIVRAVSIALAQGLSSTANRTRGVYSEGDFEVYLMDGKTKSPVLGVEMEERQSEKHQSKRVKYPMAQRRVNWAPNLEW